jgi:hypothetical protein
MGEQHLNQIEEVYMSICNIFPNISKLFYCFYGVILHLYQENFALFGGKSCSSQKQPWSDSYIQLCKWTQCSNIHAKGIRFFSFMLLHLFTSLTVLTLEVNRMGIHVLHITLTWTVSESNPFTMPFQNWSFPRCQYYPNYPHSNNFRVWKSFNQNICKNTSVH